jgi:hypothetical protein
MAGHLDMVYLGINPEPGSKTSWEVQQVVREALLHCYAPIILLSKLWNKTSRLILHRYHSKH